MTTYALSSTGIAAALRRLDRLPPRLAWGLGLGAGLGVTGALGLALGTGGWWPAALVVGVGIGVAFTGGVVEEGGEVEPVLQPFERRRSPLGFEEIRLPGGKYLMGSSPDEPGQRDDEGPRHLVEVGSFWVMSTLVTRGLYREVTGRDPGLPKDGVRELPVNQVSWFEAVAFCNALSVRAGLTPCYRIDDGNTVTWHAGADGYRLPSEAEWEYACRAGTSTRWSFGDDEAELEKYAWYDEDWTNGTVHPVAQKLPNPWGLYDVYGNVREWCWDPYGKYDDKSVAEMTDLSSLSPSAPRVLRGGAFDFDFEVRNLYSAYRFRVDPEYRFWSIGFRCVRSTRAAGIGPLAP